jgi:hypothetical protein
VGFWPTIGADFHWQKRHNCPSEFPKTIRKHPLVERPDLLRMAVLLMIGADAPTSRADFGRTLALITITLAALLVAVIIVAYPGFAPVGEKTGANAAPKRL